MQLQVNAGSQGEESQTAQTVRGIISIISMLWSIALIVIGVKFDDSCEEVSDVSTDVWLIVRGATLLAPSALFAIGFLVGLATKCCSADRKISLMTKCSPLLMCFGFLSVALLCSVGIFSLIWWAIGIATVAECYDGLGDTLRIFSVIELVVTGATLIAGCIVQQRRRKQQNDAV